MGWVTKLTTLVVPGVGRVLRLELSNMFEPEPTREQWPYHYRGFHGTSTEGLVGILRDRAIRALAPPEGCGLAMFRAMESPVPVSSLLDLLHGVFSGHKGTSGFCFEGRTSGGQHKAVRSGGAWREREIMSQDAVPTHVISDGRWSFPPERTQIMALLVVMERMRGRDRVSEVDVAEALA